MDDFEDVRQTKEEIKELRKENEIVQQELHEIKESLNVLKRLEVMVEDLCSTKTQKSLMIPDCLKSWIDHFCGKK